MIILPLLIASLASQPLLAEPDKTAPEEKKPLLIIASCPLSGLASLTYGMKPKYFRDPGRFVEMAAALSCNKGPWGTTLEIAGDLTYIEDPVEPDYEILQLGDMKLSLQTPAMKSALLQKNYLSLVGRLAAVLPFSRLSQDEGLTTKISLTAPLTFQKDAVTLSVTPGFNSFFYEKTLNKEGIANSNFSKTLTLYGSYRWEQPLAVSYSHVLIEQTPFEGHKKRYLFSTDFLLSYDYDIYSFFSGLLSKNDQIKEGKITRFKPYDKEVTQFYVGISRPL